MRLPKGITHKVWLLSLVSFFTDLASEMVYPLMPLYFAAVGISLEGMGWIEGGVVVLTGLAKGYFGRMSDLWGKRLPFVRLGYGLSALAKPLMAAFPTVAGVILFRGGDRLGKGIRTGARDALLADESDVKTRGRVFGFHRALDTLGAALGPLLALGWLVLLDGDIRGAFWLTLGPGLVAVALTWILRERQLTPVKPKGKGFFGYLSYLPRAPKAYKEVLFGLFLFALVNSSDFFLLYLAKLRGLSLTEVIGVYILYNMVYAILSYPFGAYGDRIGLGKMLALGLGTFALTYGGMAFAEGFWPIAGLFAVYGVYAAATQGIAKALLSQTIDNDEKGTALGLYGTADSIGMFVANVLMGYLFAFAGPAWALGIPAGVAVAVAIYFWMWRVEKASENRA